MRPRWWLTGLGLFLMPLAAEFAAQQAGAADEKGGAAQQPKPDGSCGRFGTQVIFVDTPSEAARQAAKDEKLVFVLHVSGHFEDPRFT